MMETTNGAPKPIDERQPWEIYLLLGLLIVFTTLVVMNNVPHVMPWLLALVAAGVALALLLPPSAGALGGLGVVVFWVLLRQTTGVWTAAYLTQSIVEMIGLALLVGLAVRYKQIWQRQQRLVAQLHSLQQVLVPGEPGTGILPYDVAMLRLNEEIDRASSFGRPLALLLVDSEPLHDLATEELQMVDRAIARKLSRAASVHDIPFRVSDTRLGLILPERDWRHLYEHAESVTMALITGGRYLDRAGHGQHLRDTVKFTFGLGTYQGEEATGLDLMRAAEDSLSVSRDLEDLGSILLPSAFAMPATPISRGETTTVSREVGG